MPPLHPPRFDDGDEHALAVLAADETTWNRFEAYISWPEPRPAVERPSREDRARWFEEAMGESVLDFLEELGDADREALVQAVLTANAATFIADPPRSRPPQPPPTRVTDPRRAGGL